MWKSWKSKALCAPVLACALLLAGCGGYGFDAAAQSGSYSQTLERADSLPAVQDFAFQANAVVTVDSATGRANVLLGNPAENTRDCRVTLMLDETGEILYETGVLHPGERTAYAQLPPEAFGGAGEYAATAVFEILDEETGESIGAVEAGVLLTLE